jgi:diguanylate cyclase (GGDEF)-like protein
VLQMNQTSNFLKSILDSVSEQIVVIDQEGAIQFVNQAWITFGKKNSCKIAPDAWQTVNYLKVCDAAAARGDAYGKQAGEGIRQVFDHVSPLFKIEYPCHSPFEKRWFVMSVTPLEPSNVPYYAISHQNITQRKLAEEHVLNLSRIDGLTNLPNRRYFDKFLTDEWKRCTRLNLPLSVAILDIDNFKLLNDHYGHSAGDACLVKIGETLNKIKKRPGDIFARYGGEEFSFVFANTTTEQALIPINKIVEQIRKLEIPNIMSLTKSFVTVSVGLATMYPERTNNEKELLTTADARLYEAKHNGRDRVVSSDIP